MKYLKNSFDYEVQFTDLEAAKKYYMPDLRELPEEREYAEEIKESDTLEELADVLNKYTDLYYNGSTFSVKIIDTISKK